MSKYHIDKIACPKCGQINEFKVWDYINIQDNPDLYWDIRNGNLFTHICENCKHMSRAIYSFMYHDKEKKIILCHASNDDDLDKMYNQVLEFFSGKSGCNDQTNAIEEIVNNDYLIRIVDSPNSVVEKLELFDYNLDDRIVELMKLIVLSSFQQSHPNQRIDEILIHIKNLDDIKMYLLDGENIVSTYNISKEFYDSIYASVDEKLPPLNCDDFIIDYNWGIEFFRENPVG